MRTTLVTFVLLGVLINFSPQVAAAGVDDTRPAELAAADKELNLIYQSLLKRLATEGQVNLRKAQKSWIQFRDLDCKWAFAAEINDCLIDRTSSRTKELNETLFFDAAGNYGTLGK